MLYATLLNACLRLRDGTRAFEVMTLMDRARLELSSQVLFQGTHTHTYTLLGEIYYYQ